MDGIKRKRGNEIQDLDEDDSDDEESYGIAALIRSDIEDDEEDEYQPGKEDDSDEEESIFETATEDELSMSEADRKMSQKDDEEYKSCFTEVDVDGQHETDDEMSLETQIIDDNELHNRIENWKHETKRKTNPKNEEKYKPCFSAANKNRFSIFEDEEMPENEEILLPKTDDDELCGNTEESDETKRKTIPKDGDD